MLLSLGKSNGIIALREAPIMTSAHKLSSCDQSVPAMSVNIERLSYGNTQKIGLNKLASLTGHGRRNTKISFATLIALNTRISNHSHHSAFASLSVHVIQHSHHSELVILLTHTIKKY